MDKQKAIEVVKGYFPNYPNINQFHVTHDEQVFEDAQHADNHARSLGKDKNIVHVVSRDEVPFETTPVEDAETIQLKKAVTNAEKEVAKKQKAFDNAADKNKPAKEIELNTAKQALADATTALNAKLTPAE